MTRIGLISDTHGFLDESVFRHFKDCDEIWHAGDFGNADLADKLSAFKPLKGVYGNIDGMDIRAHYPEQLVFMCESVKVMMRHSHILKVIYDQQYQCLHINPGAAGKQGWHKVRTLVRLTIDGKEMKDCNVIELR